MVFGDAGTPLFMIPAAPGTYALMLRCRSAARIRVGTLGDLDLRPGLYVYIGSALGPGGLRARIRHHCGAAERPHWHIDYLRAHTQPEAVCCSADGIRREHEWARRIAAMRGALDAMPRFGSSDCRCPAHLYYFERPPSPAAFRRALSAPTLRLTPGR